MDKQMTISAFSDELAQVRTKKKEFLTQIERIVSWKEWLCLIQPCYYMEKKRDPDAHQVKKGNTWHFGYKAHIGVDRDSGLVHTVEGLTIHCSFNLYWSSILPMTLSLMVSLKERIRE